MIYLIVIFLAVYVFVVLKIMLSRKNKYNGINPMIWTIVSWSLIIGMYFFSGVDYYHTVSVYTWLYIILSGIIFFSFYGMGFIARRRNNISWSKRIKKPIINMNWYYLIAIVGLVLYMFDIYRLNNIIGFFGNRKLGLKISALGTLGSVLNNISLFLWLYSLTFSIKENKRISMRGIIALTLYLIPNIFIGGRQAILITAISSTAILIYTLKINKSYKYKSQLKRYAFVAITIIILYFGVVTSKRSEVFNNTNNAYEYLFNASTSETVLKVTDKLGYFGDTFIQFSYYYSHELPAFEIFINDYEHDLLLGMYQFNYISRRLPQSWGLDYRVVYDELDRLSMNASIIPTAYRTALFAYIIDYGKIGALFFIAGIGFFIGILMNGFNRNPDIYKVVLLSILCAGSFFSIQYSPIFEPRWVYPFFWTLLIITFENIRLRPIKRS